MDCFLDLADSDYSARNDSNMALLDADFLQAHDNLQVKLVVIASQANPFECFLETKSRICHLGIH